MLVINQLAGSYECRSEVLITHYERSMQLLKEFKDFRLEYVPRLHNEEANRLAQHASRPSMCSSKENYTIELLMEFFSDA